MDANLFPNTAKNEDKKKHSHSFSCAFQLKLLHHITTSVFAIITFSDSFHDAGNLLSAQSWFVLIALLQVPLWGFLATDLCEG